MKEHSSFFFYLHIALVTMSLVKVDAESMLSWIWGHQEDLPKIGTLDDVPLISIPYELLTEDEKFLKEAAKLVTDIQISSPLEICQHKVVLKIKTSCTSMTEEQLAKLSVNLLNCQSLTEGRRVFPCTEDMTIKQCTTHMDADTWNAYHLMSNRARAVCYASRSHQFRALTELTVNKLMQSAQTQIQTLSSLKESQDRLEEQSIAAHKLIESNIEDLTNEKALIRTGHIQIATMTEEIKRKLEKASQDLMNQSAIHDENHEEILADLKNIEMQAQLLWNKIESSTNRIIAQNEEVSAQYEETLIKLEKINETIVFMSDLSNNMRNEIDKKLGWITEYIGKTGENLEKIYQVILHIVYLFGAMVVAAFLQAPFLTRSAILTIVPLNLASYLKHGLDASLDFVSLSFLILLITTMHFVMNGIHYLMRSKDENNKKEQKDSDHYHNKKEDTINNGNSVINEHSDTQINEPLQFIILKTISNLWKSLIQQISKSIKNIKATYLSMKSWIWQKCDATEELSCSYLPARRYHEAKKYIAGYPSLSDDSSDFSDAREVENVSSKLKGNNITPLSKFFKGLKEPIIVENSHISSSREVSPQRSTPVTRALCSANTRSGNPCRLLASKGQNYCHRHVSGSSSMGDFS